MRDLSRPPILIKPWADSNFSRTLEGRREFQTSESKSLTSRSLWERLQKIHYKTIT